MLEAQQRMRLWRLRRTTNRQSNAADVRGRSPQDDRRREGRDQERLMPICGGLRRGRALVDGMLSQLDRLSTEVIHLYLTGESRGAAARAASNKEL